jgi:hypothetical protein
MTDVILALGLFAGVAIAIGCDVAAVVGWIQSRGRR